MINGRPRRIHLTKGAESRYEEGRAGGVITPGMLIALIAGEWLAHATANGVGAEKAFALEDALQGRTIDDNYADGELVRIILPVSGDVILAILAAGEDITNGDQLASDGAGGLIAATAGAGAVAVALEDRDATDSVVTLEDRRIRVRIL